MGESIRGASHNIGNTKPVLAAEYAVRVERGCVNEALQRRGAVGPRGWVAESRLQNWAGRTREVNSQPMTGPV